ncbi:hypothetical protein [Haloquadratum walsbyi]|nr:hypothetical protein [Haloquadratum walsbyi]
MDQLIVLADPILSFSGMLPDRSFRMTPGVIFLAGGVFLYWSEIGSDDKT